MAEQLRWILLLLGILVIGWVIWDGWRRRRQQEMDMAPRKEPHIGEDAVITSDEVTAHASTELITEHATETGDTHAKCRLPDAPQLVITLHLMAELGSEFAGGRVLQLLEALDCRLGSYDIFHWHDNGEHGFCVANAFQPGTFDRTKMADEPILGLAFFMTLPSHSQPLKVFEQMLAVLNKLQQQLGGNLEDGDHNPLTSQTVSHYREQLKEFARRQLTQVQQDGEDDH